MSWSIYIRLCVLACVVSSFAFAEGQNKKLSLNLYGGFSFTGNSGDNTAGGVSGRTGLAFGFGGEYRIQKAFSVGIDLLNVFKGYEERTGSDVTYYNVNYLSVPLLLKWWPIENNLCFQAGPYLPSLIISANRDNGGVSTPLKDQFANDFGMTFGAWFGFKASAVLNVGVDVRYDLGMNDIQADALPQSSVRTRALMTFLRFGFMLK